MNLEPMIEYFVEFPNLLSRSTGKFLSGRAGKKELFDGATPKDIQDAKQQARIRMQKTDTVSSQSKEENFEKGTLKSEIEINFEPKDYKELADLHKIDLTKYKISNYWSKLKSNGKFTSSVLATLLKPSDVSLDDVMRILKEYKSTHVPVRLTDVIVNKSKERPSCAFFDITDVHIDKKELTDTPIESKVDTYFRVLDILLLTAYQTRQLDEIVFIIGNDFLHVDNIQNTTTKGTPQETDMRYHQSFTIAFDMYVKSIQKLKQFCNNLTVILVQGNHAYTKEFYLAFALQQYFSTDNNITFDIRPVTRKVFVYGNTFIGLHHGNCKIDALPTVFAKEFPQLWGQCKYHEIKVGDKHHFMEKDYHGVRIKLLPALTGPDTWHDAGLYVAQDRGSICSIYDLEKGRTIDIEEKI